MSWSVNRVVLVGRVATDVQLKYTPSGTPVATFRLAVGKRVKPDSVQQGNDAYFFTIVVWNRLAELCNSFLSKGKLVAVDGRLSQRRVKMSDGSMREFVEVVAEVVQFLSPKEDTAKDKTIEHEVPPTTDIGEFSEPMEDVYEAGEIDHTPLVDEDMM